MSALRPDDSLSARLNQIVDRYLDMVGRDRRDIMERFPPDVWAAMATAATAATDPPTPAKDMRERLAIAAGPDHTHAVRYMKGGDLIVLIELLENERWGEPPATHSQGDRDDAR